MKKLLNVLLIVLALLPSMGRADSEVKSVFNESASGTTSATVFIAPADGFGQVTDLCWRLDAATTTGLIIVRPGEAQFSISSATSGSGTVVWFTNTNTQVAVGEYIILYDDSAQTYLLRQVTAATTTSITVSESISVALTTSDKVWSVLGSFARPVPTTASQTTMGGSIWLPRSLPTAITVDGNTTACRISVSGIRTSYR